MKFVMIPRAYESAVVAQLVEHIHGKDEVIGSIPINGSIESLDEFRADTQAVNEGRL